MSWDIWSFCLCSISHTGTRKKTSGVCMLRVRWPNLWKANQHFLVNVEKVSVAVMLIFYESVLPRIYFSLFSPMSSLSVASFPGVSGSLDPWHIERAREFPCNKTNFVVTPFHLLTDQRIIFILRYSLNLWLLEYASNLLALLLWLWTLWLKGPYRM